MTEIWKDIEGYEGLYQVSNLGRVKSLERRVRAKKPGTTQRIKERIRKFSYTTEGYAYVVLSKEGVHKTILVHRLVADAFVPNPDNLPCVNHKDEDKKNDTSDNLEWCTYSYNNTYKDVHRRRNLDNVKRMVIQYDLEMNEIKRWSLMSDACREYNIGPGNMAKCCKGERVHCAGFKWRYYE